jgi:hypothetical protein
MVMVSIPQSKEIHWSIGLKNKMELFVDYKKCTSLAKTNTGLKQKNSKLFPSKWNLKAIH